MTTATLLRGCGASLSAVASAAMLTVSVQTAPAFPHPAEAQSQAGPAGVKTDPLFTPAARTADAPPSDMDEHAIRRAPINVSEKALASGIVLSAEAHILNLFPDVRILAMRSRVESRSRTAYSWFGHIPGDEFGRVIITVANGKLGAAVTHNGRRYLILPSPDGGHEVFEIDDRTFQTGDDVERVFPVDGGAPKPIGAPTSPVLEATPLDSGGFVQIVGWDLVASNGGGLKMTMGPEDGSVIDVMVVYTHAAAQSMDWLHNALLGHDLPYGLVVRVQLGIDIANQSFIDSSVPTHLNVVGDPYEDPSYQEEGIASFDRAAVRNGLLAGVHHEREDRAADLVLLVTARAKDDNGKRLCGQSSGRPWVVDDEAQAAAYGYLLVKASCLTTYAPAHEIGHQLGATHDWYALTLQGATGGAEAPHGHGYTWAGGGKGFFTIMAYDWYCRDHVTGYAESGANCSRLDRWSDPYAAHPVYGVPLGQPELTSPEPAHDAKTVTLNRKAVANYRNAACRATNGC